MGGREFHEDWEESCIEGLRADGKHRFICGRRRGRGRGRDFGMVGIIACRDENDFCWKHGDVSPGMVRTSVLDREVRKGPSCSAEHEAACLPSLCARRGFFLAHASQCISSLRFFLHRMDCVNLASLFLVRPTLSSLLLTVPSIAPQFGPGLGTLLHLSENHLE